jgi:hypothetical protein
MNHKSLIIRTSIPALIILAVCMGCSSTPREEPLASDLSPSPIVSPTADLERNMASTIALHVVEPVDEILSLSEKGTNTVNQMAGAGTITRMEFMMLAGGVLDEAKKDKDLRKRFTVDRNGKYKFEQIATAAFVAGLQVANGRKK